MIIRAKVTKTEVLLARCLAKPGWKKEKVAKTCEKYIREFHTDVKALLERGVDLAEVICTALWEVVQEAITEAQS